ncbi:unnamed protein product [Effrenium voratum]|nr:unnamed protein product [Effrenium voratum]
MQVDVPAAFLSSQFPWLKSDPVSFPAMQATRSVGLNSSEGDSGDVGDPVGSLASERQSRKHVHVTGSFIHAAPEAFGETQLKTLKHIMRSPILANIMALVVLIDAFCTCSDIDARANGPGVSAPEVFTVVSKVCLVLYTVELMGLLWTTTKNPLFDWVMLLDIVIVLCGWTEVIMEATDTASLSFDISVLRALRLVRIVRLIRMLKRVRPLKELHKLVVMMSTCFRALLWSFLLCFFVMTGWAMLMVEIVNPLVKELNQKHGIFSDCDDCMRATSSIMDANLLLFKTVIAGDSWGQIAVPVIQHYPATGLIFVGSLLTLVFGVLNLIVAVVVDQFADARQNDVENLAEEMEEDIESDKKALAKLFARIDEDGSGQLTLEELIEGARKDAAFHSRLRVMDIDENDLQQLFYMIDRDRSGTIEVAEFIGPLSRWARDSKTAPRFIKYNMLQTLHLSEDLYDLSMDCFKNLSERIDDISAQIQVLARGARPGAISHPVNEEGSEVCVPLEAPRPSGRSSFLQTPWLEEESKSKTANRDLETMLESAMSKLEARLMTLFHDRGPSRAPSKQSKQSAREAPEIGRKRPILHPEAFRQMYIDKGRQPTFQKESQASNSLADWMVSRARRITTRDGSDSPERRSPRSAHARSSESRERSRGSTPGTSRVQSEQPSSPSRSRSSSEADTRDL